MKKLSVANGTYQKDGQEKTRWVNVGVILEKDGKEFALIDPTINFAAFPREQGKDMVMVGVFEEQSQNQNQGYNQNQGNQNQQHYGNNNNQGVDYSSNPQGNYNNQNQGYNNQ